MHSTNREDVPVPSRQPLTSGELEQELPGAAERLSHRDPQDLYRQSVTYRRGRLSLYVVSGIEVKINTELVETVVRIAQKKGRDIAAPDEARWIVGITALNQSNIVPRADGKNFFDPLETPRNLLQLDRRFGLGSHPAENRRRGKILIDRGGV